MVLCTFFRYTAEIAAIQCMLITLDKSIRVLYYVRKRFTVLAKLKLDKIDHELMTRVAAYAIRFWPRHDRKMVVARMLREALRRYLRYCDNGRNRHRRDPD